MQHFIKLDILTPSRYRKIGTFISLNIKFLSTKPSFVQV
jgi:hypothetical protein